MKEDTKIIHKGRDPKSNHGIINPPVYHASTIAWGSVEEMKYRRDHRWEPGVYTYGRHGTPTHDALEEAFAAVSRRVPLRRTSHRGSPRSTPPCSPT